MLVSLGFQKLSSSSPDREDAFTLLQDCHQRIRTFTALAIKLAAAVDAPPGDVVEVAGRLVRYFTVGLPKHVADEDLSLAPRLRALELSSEVLTRLDEMGREHRELELVLERLVPRWQELQTAPERLAGFAKELAQDSEWLATHMEEHLKHEEQVLFPVARARLSKESLATLEAEMRARRGMAPVA